MTAIREIISVKDHKIDYTLPDDFNFDEVEIIIMPKNTPTENNLWEYWDDKEIDNFGKIAIGLSNHNYDDEDYSKW